MQKQTYQEVMWLFHELGRHLQAAIPGVPEDCDARALLRAVIDKHQPRMVAGRNPFNWLKELQTAANFWHHLQPESVVPEDDTWRDLDTLERVAKCLALDPAYLESIHDIKVMVRSGPETQDRQLEQEDIMALVKEEVARQLEQITFQTTNTTLVSAFLKHMLAEVTLGESDANNEEAILGAVSSWIKKEVLERAMPLQGTVPRREGGADNAHQTQTVPRQERSEHADRVRDLVQVRAGDVDKALGYRYRRLPLICAALRSQKFLAAAGVELRGETGPPSGASTTTTFRYALL